MGKVKLSDCFYSFNYGPAGGSEYLWINYQCRSEWAWMRVWLNFFLPTFLCPIIDFLSRPLALYDLLLCTVQIAALLLLLHPILSIPPFSEFCVWMLNEKPQAIILLEMPSTVCTESYYNYHYLSRHKCRRKWVNKHKFNCKTMASARPAQFGSYYVCSWGTAHWD